MYVPGKTVGKFFDGLLDATRQFIDGMEGLGLLTLNQIDSAMDQKQGINSTSSSENNVFGRYQSKNH